MENKNVFTQKIRGLRGNKSQAKIAAEIGIPKSNWNMYERGDRTPSDKAKVKIANHFGMTVQEIFFSNCGNTKYDNMEANK